MYHFNLSSDPDDVIRDMTSSDYIFHPKLCTPKQWWLALVEILLVGVVRRSPSEETVSILLTRKRNKNFAKIIFGKKWLTFSNVMVSLFQTHRIDCGLPNRRVFSLTL